MFCPGYLKCVIDLDFKSYFFFVLVFYHFCNFIFCCCF